MQRSRPHPSYRGRSSHHQSLALIIIYSLIGAAAVFFTFSLFIEAPSLKKGNFGPSQFAQVVSRRPSAPLPANDIGGDASFTSSSAAVAAMDAMRPAPGGGGSYEKEEEDEIPLKRLLKPGDSVNSSRQEGNEGRNEHREVKGRDGLLMQHWRKEEGGASGGGGQRGHPMAEGEKEKHDDAPFDDAGVKVEEEEGQEDGEGQDEGTPPPPGRDRKVVLEGVMKVEEVPRKAAPAEGPSSYIAEAGEGKGEEEGGEEEQEKEKGGRHLKQPSTSPDGDDHEVLEKIREQKEDQQAERGKARRRPAVAADTEAEQEKIDAAADGVGEAGPSSAAELVGDVAAIEAEQKRNINPAAEAATAAPMPPRPRDDDGVFAEEEIEEEEEVEKEAEEERQEQGEEEEVDNREVEVRKREGMGSEEGQAKEGDIGEGGDGEESAAIMAPPRPPPPLDELAEQVAALEGGQVVPSAIEALVEEGIRKEGHSIEEEKEKEKEKEDTKEEGEPKRRTKKGKKKGGHAAMAAALPPPKPPAVVPNPPDGMTCQAFLEEADAYAYARDFDARPIAVYRGSEVHERDDCEMKCIYSVDPFGPYDATYGGFGGVPKIIWTMESWTNYPGTKLETAHKDGYDIVMTPRLDSEVPCVYFGWAPENEIFFNPFKFPPTPAKDKKNVAAAFISNCGAASFRLEALEGLAAEGAPVHSYGRCANNQPDTNKDRLLPQIKFSLAFENSIEDDYVTEKYLQALNFGAVPVVIGAPNIMDFAPSENSVLHLQTSQDIPIVAKQMLYLMSNDTAYDEMLAWKVNGPSDQFLALIDIGTVHPECRLCNYLADKSREGERRAKPKDRPCACQEKGEKIHHLYIREKGTFYYRSLFLHEPITVDSMHKAIKEEVYGPGHKPVWSRARPSYRKKKKDGSWDKEDIPLRIHKVYPSGLNNKEALYSKLPDPFTIPNKPEHDLYLEEWIKEHPCGELEVAFV